MRFGWIVAGCGYRPAFARNDHIAEFASHAVDEDRNGIPMTVHCFVDESRRNTRYLLAAVMVDPAELAGLRKVMRSLLLPGQREVHFQKEKPARRRSLVDRIVGATRPG